MPEDIGGDAVHHRRQATNGSKAGLRPSDLWPCVRLHRPVCRPRGDLDYDLGRVCGFAVRQTVFGNRVANIAMLSLCRLPTDKL